MIESISKFLMTGGVSGKNTQGFGNEDLFSQLMQAAPPEEQTGEQSMALAGALFVAVPTGLSELRDSATSPPQDKAANSLINPTAVPVSAQMRFGNGVAAGTTQDPAEARLTPPNAALLAEAGSEPGDTQVTPPNAVLLAKAGSEPGGLQFTTSAGTGRIPEVVKSSEARARQIPEEASLQRINQAVGDGDELAGDISKRTVADHSIRFTMTREHATEEFRHNTTSPEFLKVGNEPGVESLNARTDGMTSASSPATLTTALSSSNSGQPLQAQIHAAFGSEQWAEELQGRLVRVAVNGENQVALHLNPRELGPLTVELKMVENQAQLQFVSSHQNVRHAVEQAIPLLREMLSEQGIALGDSNVSQESQQQQQQQQRQDRRLAETQQTEAVGLVGPTRGTPKPTEAEGKINIYI